MTRNHQRRRAKHIALFTLMLAVSFLIVTPIYAATFTVNDNGDAIDATPGDGVCATAGAVCTLRAAIDEANALAGDDIINFSSVTLVNTATALTINSNITINGMGVTVDNTGTGRVFNITSGTVVIAGLTIQGGDNINSGAGIQVIGTTSILTLQSGARVTANDAASFGSGIFASTNAQVTVTGTGTAVTANLGATNGGGIAALSGADVFIQDGATVSNHTGTPGSSGGGVYLSGTGTTLTVQNGGTILSLIHI